MNFRRGFTLIEAVFALGVASVLLIGIYTYFVESIRNSAKGEETLSTIRDMQNFIMVLRQDLYEANGFLRSDVPVDLHQHEKPFPLEPRYFPCVVYDDVSAASDKIQVLPIQRTVVERFTSAGSLGYEYVDKYDSFFDKKIFTDGSPDFMLNSFAVVTREIEKPFPAKVREFYIGVKGDKVWYRHYLTDRTGDIKFNFVSRMIGPGEGEETHRFGQLHGADGRIEDFSIEPNFEFSYYRDKKDPKVLLLRLTKVYHHAKMVFKGEKQGSGPEGRTIAQSFFVVNSVFNGERFRHGTGF
jgi:type II secretory pathway pseudopilin PulG